ncbi:baseplate assembly protein [Niveispirillum sp. SYP-B3756]|uniref:baseplate assembly protein n=1 Tax=Niveispirillum sp. SYP-B3756 TaxID=2662178 RepID=UPI0012917AFF|nr:baseplate J/gp47 family protein [Niveispirillum sp. SYP-B3756]MQP64712.1 baseplate assembly protein [Niveispirillum sp. SYP-B3756]
MSIDLSRLPPPQVVDQPEYDSIRAALIADFTRRWPDFGAVTESEPVIKLIELVAYLSLLHRTRVNDAARDVMLAYAEKGTLEHLGALLGVERRAGESDTALRARIQQAPQGFSTAGPAAAYRYHAMRAHPEVRQAGVDSPSPGLVRVIILAATGDGTAPAPVLDAVTALLTHDDVCPLTDRVLVVPAEITRYDVVARLELYDGPDSVPVVATAEAAARDYVATRHALGEVVAVSGIIAALHVAGVRRVFLAAPASDIVCRADQAAWCQSLRLSVVTP